MFLLHGHLWMLLSLVSSLNEASVGHFCVLLNNFLDLYRFLQCSHQSQSGTRDQHFTMTNCFQPLISGYQLFFSCFQLFSPVLFNIGSFVNCLLLLKLFLSQDWRTFAVVHVIVAVLVVLVKLDLQLGVNLQSMRYKVEFEFARNSIARNSIE